MKHSPEVAHVITYLQILYRRRWTAGAAFLVVFLNGAVSSLKTVPVYEASAQLVIDHQARKVTSLDTALDQDSGGADDFLPTELRILQSRALARRTVDALGVSRNSITPAPPPADSSFSVTGMIGRATAQVLQMARQAIDAPARIDPPPADESARQAAEANAFLGGLAVTPVRDTRAVYIRYRSADPEYAARAANELARQYIQQSIEQRFSASKETSDWLSKQLDDQGKKLRDSEAALQKYKETHDAVAVDDRQNIVIQKLADLNAAVTKVKMERIDKEAEYNRLASLKQDREALDSVPAIISNGFIQQLKTEIAALQRQQSLLSVKYGERHPEMVNVTTDLKRAEAKLQIEIDKVVESVKSEFLTAQSREQSLEQALEAQKKEALSLDRRGIEFAVLQRDALSNRELYDNLIKRTKESGVSEDYRGTSIRIIDRAEIPRSPVLPQTRRDFTTAALLASLAAAALAFGFERLDNRIKSPDEIKAYLRVPFLGLVPMIPGRKDADASQLLNSGVPPAFSEAIRAIRTAVVFSSPDEKGKSVLVTSTGPHEGKTLVASNLAVALAQAGQRTLLIDGDMRRPRAHTLFDREQEPGLSNVLVDDGDLKGALRPTAIPNLSMLPAGHVPPNPAELLSSKRCEALMAGLTERFDWIIIDAPPVLAVTDASIISHATGGVLFVIGAEMTPRTSAATAIEQLTGGRARILGAVLNRVNVKRHAYYYAPYYRKEYSQYHHSPSPS